MDDLFFNGWQPLLRTMVIGILGYAGGVIILRVSGKRTLAKFNMFDFVITIAFGSLLASMMLSASVSLLQGLTAICTLTALQWGVTSLTSRFSWADRLMKSEPRLLYHNGTILRTALRQERIAESELADTVRDSSLGGLETVTAIILEADGTMSVIPKEKAGEETAIPKAKRHRQSLHGS